MFLPAPVSGGGWLYLNAVRQGSGRDDIRLETAKSPGHLVLYGSFRLSTKGSGKVDTLLRLRRVTNKDLLSSMDNSAQYYAAS